MSRSRRYLVLLLPLLLVFAACGGDQRADLGPNVKHELSAGAAYAARLLVAGHTGVPDDQSVIALGYLERLRLGLGSPFRLADYALHDPRLGDDVRRPLAWAILGRTLNGDAYRIDPAALDCVGASEAGYRPGIGRYHLQMIEAAIAEAADPRAGELAVRLAYTLAAGEGSVWRGAPRVVAQAAALARDRALARAMRNICQSTKTRHNCLHTGDSPAHGRYRLIHGDELVAGDLGFAQSQIVTAHALRDHLDRELALRIHDCAERHHHTDRKNERQQDQECPHLAAAKASKDISKSHDSWTRSTISLSSVRTPPPATPTTPRAISRSRPTVSSRSASLSGDFSRSSFTVL